MGPLRILVVDLNNFARYPTIAVGYLASILRGGGEHVTVFSPLAYGVPGVPREMRETTWHVGSTMRSLVRTTRSWAGPRAPWPMRETCGLRGHIVAS
jgi:hypothetical protein